MFSYYNRRMLTTIQAKHKEDADRTSKKKSPDELSRKITLIDSLQTIMHFMHIVYMYQYQILTNILHNTYIHFDFYRCMYTYTKF